jgi:RHS repeat-associated protein
MRSANHLFIRAWQRIASTSANVTRKTLQTLSASLLSLVALSSALPAPTALHAAESVLYFHNDISGTPLAATDASGNVVWKETYRPYGERINNAPTSNTGKGKNELYFHGKQQEPLNGGVTIQYFGARYYDPSIGRFMGVDPVHFVPPNVHSFNRFAYGNNNPYKFHDPDGNTPAWIPVALHVGGGAIMGGGAAGAVNALGQLYLNGSIQWGGAGGVWDAASEGAQIGMLLGPSVSASFAGAGAAASRATSLKTVGRHMSPEELAAMQRTGRVQEGGGGQTRVADPASKDTYKNAPKGDVYVEFDVPANRVLPHSSGTGRIPGPNSPDARASGKNGVDFQMPAASNIKVP